MKFENIYRKSIIVRPTDPEGIFIHRILNVSDGNIYNHLGNQLVLSLIDPKHLEQFDNGYFQHLPKYVSERKGEEWIIDLATRGLLRTLDRSPRSTLPLQSGEYVYEYSPHRRTA